MLSMRKFVLAARSIFAISSEQMNRKMEQKFVVLARIELLKDNFVIDTRRIRSKMDSKLATRRIRKRPRLVTEFPRSNRAVERTNVQVSVAYIRHERIIHSLYVVGDTEMRVRGDTRVYLSSCGATR